MQYKTILKPYDVVSLIGETVEDSKTSPEPLEPVDWNNALNRYAKDGWIVASSGAIESGTAIIFWALLEKTEQEQAINTGF